MRPNARLVCILSFLFTPLTLPNMYPPSNMLPACILFILLFFNLCTLAATDNAQVSLCFPESSSFQNLRRCAKDCFQDGDCGILADQLSCVAYGQIQNSCFCRDDLIGDGTDYLSSCINSKCSSNTIDVKSAVELYTGYCESAPTLAITRATSTTDSGALTVSHNSLDATPAATTTVTVVTSRPTMSSGVQSSVTDHLSPLWLFLAVSCHNNILEKKH
jgi:hypothetical protein